MYFRNLDEIKEDSDAEYEGEETEDVDTKDETAPFGKNCWYSRGTCSSFSRPARSVLHQPRLDSKK